MTGGPEQTSLSKKKSERPAPWMGQKSRGDSQSMTARSRENRDSGFRSRQGPNALSLTEGRSSGSGLDKRRDPGKKPAEYGKRKSDVSTLDLCKRSRDNSLVSVKRLGVHPLLLDVVNRKESVESFWDSSDFGVGLRKGATIVADYDLGHLIPRSSDVLLQSIALNSCQFLSAVRALQAQGDKFRADDAKLRKDLTKLEEDASHSEVSASKANEEFQHLESVIVNLREEVRLLQEKSEVTMKENEGFRDELRLYEKC